jgi:hypothetical protein
MTHYYFHLENGQTLLDDTGVELRDIAAAQNEALEQAAIFSGPGLALPLLCGMGHHGECG